MRKLILMRHSEPAIDPSACAHDWRLSEEGRRRCVPLAEALRSHAPTALFASPEPKAAETAELVAELLALAVTERDDLRETDRTGVPFMTQAKFDALVRAYFAAPGARVFGGESANEAYSRFARAIDRILTDHPEGNIAVVAHGTVITLLLARAEGRDPFSMWRDLTTPWMRVVDAELASTNRQSGERRESTPGPHPGPTPSSRSPRTPRR